MSHSLHNRHEKEKNHQIPTDANIEWANIGKVCLAEIIVSTIFEDNISSLIAYVLGAKKQLPSTVVEFQLLAPNSNLLAS